MSLHRHTPTNKCGTKVRIRISPSCHLKLMGLGQRSLVTANITKRQELTLCLVVKLHSIVYGNQSNKNLVKFLDFTVSLQEIQKTKEHVKLHHGDANSKSRLSELYKQMTWSPRQVNNQHKWRTCRFREICQPIAVYGLTKENEKEKKNL